MYCWYYFFLKGTKTDDFSTSKSNAKGNDNIYFILSRRNQNKRCVVY